MKRKKTIHAAEPDTKKSIIGVLTDDENDLDIGSLRAKQEDMKIVSLAILGRSIRETYSNSRIELAVTRQTAEAMMSGLMSPVPPTSSALSVSPRYAVNLDRDQDCRWI